MNRIWLAALLLVSVSACSTIKSTDVTAGPGAVVRVAEGKSGGLATVGFIVNDKWDLRAYYVGEQRIYEETVIIDAFPAVSASRLWTFRDGRNFRPFLGVGLMVKGAQRCHYNGDTDCNRMMPLPFGFLATAGFRWGDVLITIGHASNSGLDYGPEKKNLGLDHIRAEIVF
jgi:hypothetical protein